MSFQGISYSYTGCQQYTVYYNDDDNSELVRTIKEFKISGQSLLERKIVLLIEIDKFIKEKEEIDKILNSSTT